MVAAAVDTTTTVLPGTGLNSTLVERALDALLKHHEKQVEKEESTKNKKTSLLGNDRPVQVQLTLFRIPGKSSNCPIRVSIPHPLYQVHKDDDGGKDMDVDDDTQEEAEICFIVKEESKPYIQDMIDKFPKYMGCIKKVLGLQSLRKKHAQYEQQRELLHKYNMFLVDDRILPMVGKALGKHFYKSKRLPIPIKVTRQESLPYMIQKTLKSTFLTINQGTCITIRAGHTGMDSKKIVKNIMAISNNAIPKIPHKWANIQLISIKTPDSMSLPVYNKTPEALLELAQLAGITEDGQEEEEQKEKESKAKADSKKRKNVVGDMKSPLVRALKKQKQIEEDEKKKEDEKKTKEKKTKQHKDDETNKNKKNKKTKNEEEVEEPSAATGGDDDNHHKKKKQRKSTEGKDGASDEQRVVEEPTPTKKSKQIDYDDGKKKEETKLKKQKKKDDDEVDDDKNKKEFKAASKFKGSKKGYVFKMGKKGLGYYVDVKPVVDKMAMDALRRSAGGGGGSRRGGVKHNKKNKYKGTRRF